MFFIHHLLLIILMITWPHTAILCGPLGIPKSWLVSLLCNWEGLGLRGEGQSALSSFYDCCFECWRLTIGILQLSLHVPPASYISATTVFSRKKFTSWKMVSFSLEDEIVTAPPFLHLKRRVASCIGFTANKYARFFINTWINSEWSTWTFSFHSSFLIVYQQDYKILHLEVLDLSV